VFVTAVHTLAMLAVTTAVALVVHERPGVAVLRGAWLHPALLWGVALIGAAPGRSPPSGNRRPSHLPTGAAYHIRGFKGCR
jgi:hypothetical protein